MIFVELFWWNILINCNNKLIIEFVTIATTGDATDFGDLTESRRSWLQCSSPTVEVHGVVDIIQSRIQVLQKFN